MPIPPDLEQRLSAARVDRGRRQAQINDFMRFADPTKPRIGETPNGSTDRGYEADERFDTTMEEVAEDFAADLIQRVMPRQTNWLTYEPADAVKDEVKTALADPLTARTAVIFDAIRGSDFYDEAVGEAAMDFGHGTAGVIITDPGSGQPFHCEAIPPSQLLIERGARGGTSLRAREYRMAAEEALAYWPDYKWSTAFRRRAAAKSSRRDKVVVIEAATRIYDKADERWSWQVCVDQELVHEDEVRGLGCCPVQAARWRTHSTSAWGIGPLLKAVPDAKTLDQERYLILKNLGKTVDPPVVYDDDGVLNPEGGVGAGMWIPRLAGSKVEEMGGETNLSAAYYEQGGLQDNIRRAGFQYGPRQRGKTPPTLGQWMDEKGDEGRRLELPTGKLYAEFVVAIVQRFEYLLIQRGSIQPSVVPRGMQQAIKVRPLNPLSRQQDMEEVQTAVQLLQQFNAIAGPQIVGATVDLGATLTAIKTKLNDKLVQLRPPQQAQPLLDGALGASPPQQGGQPQQPPQQAQQGPSQ